MDTLQADTLLCAYPAGEVIRRQGCFLHRSAGEDILGTALAPRPFALVRLGIHESLVVHRHTQGGELLACRLGLLRSGALRADTPIVGGEGIECGNKIGCIGQLLVLYHETICKVLVGGNVQHEGGVLLARPRELCARERDIRRSQCGRHRTGIEQLQRDVVEIERGGNRTLVLGVRCNPIFGVGTECNVVAVSLDARKRDIEALRHILVGSRCHSTCQVVGIGACIEVDKG